MKSANCTSERRQHSFKSDGKNGLGPILATGVVMMLLLMPGIAGALPFLPCMEYDCYVGSSYRNTIPTPQTTGAVGSGNIFDAINRFLGTSYNHNRYVDQYFLEPDYIWTQSFSVGQTAVVSYRIGNHNTLGVYSDVGTGNTRTELLGPYTGQTGFVADGTQASPYPAATFNVGQGNNFGWYLKTVSGSGSGATTLYWFSEPSLNNDPESSGDGIDHIATYHISGLDGIWVKFGNGAAEWLELEDPYLICFEDLPAERGYYCDCHSGREWHLGDEDYDDMIFIFDKVTPVTGIRIVKTNDTDGECVTLGDIITYTYNVSNDGNLNIADVEVTDNLVSPVTYVSGDTNLDNKLNPSEIWTYTGTYTVTQADIQECGPIVNIARVNATDPENPSNEITNFSTNSICTYFDANFTVDKIAEYDGYPNPAASGTTINYKIWINNTGNVNLTNTDVTDSLYDLGSIATKAGDTYGPGVLNVSENWLYEFDIIVSEDPSPWINNTVVATFTDPCGNQIQKSDCANVSTATCQIANAGDDKITCAGEPVVLEGSATNSDSVVWSIESCNGSKELGCGSLEWPLGGTDSNKSEYTPPSTGVVNCTLNFTARGACPDVSDFAIVYVIENPDPDIRFEES